MAGQIDDDSRGENQDIILAGRDFDAVRVCPVEELLGHTRNLGFRAPKSVLVIEKVAPGLEIVRAGDIDVESVMKEREELLLHNGDLDTCTKDFVRRSPCQHFLLDVRELVAVQVLKRKLVAEGKRSPVNEKGVVPILVLDMKIISPGEQLLLQDITQSYTASESEVKLKSFTRSDGIT